MFRWWQGARLQWTRAYRFDAFHVSSKTPIATYTSAPCWFKCVSFIPKLSASFCSILQTDRRSRRFPLRFLPVRYSVERLKDGLRYSGTWGTCAFGWIWVRKSFICKLCLLLFICENPRLDLWVLHNFTKRGFVVAGFPLVCSFRTRLLR